MKAMKLVPTMSKLQNKVIEFAVWFLCRMIAVFIIVYFIQLITGIDLGAESYFM